MWDHKSTMTKYSIFVASAAGESAQTKCFFFFLMKMLKQNVKIKICEQLLEPTSAYDEPTRTSIVTF